MHYFYDNTPVIGCQWGDWKRHIGEEMHIG